MVTAARQLACPRCRTAMIVMPEGRVALDTCGSCRGLWLDGDEWARVLGSAAHADASSRRGSERIPCPACAAVTRFGQESALMQPSALDGAPEVTLDRCGGCGGIWLDGGELLLLRKRLPRDAAPQQRVATAPLVASGPTRHDVETRRYLSGADALVDTLGDVLLLVGRPRQRRRFFGLGRPRRRWSPADALFTWLGNLLKRR